VGDRETFAATDQLALRGRHGRMGQDPRAHGIHGSERPAERIHDVRQE
jgi:hypothetical protein